MSPTLPVPSKAALRALRHIALGTSCTVAVGAGLITEDRRRRIHSVREVHENGKRIRNSKKYHSGGSLVGDVFNDQSLNYGDHVFAAVNPRLQEQDEWSQKAPQLPLFTRDPYMRSMHKETTSNVERHASTGRQSTSHTRRFIDGRTITGHQAMTRPLQTTTTKSGAVQKTAREVMSQLQNGAGLHTVHAAADTIKHMVNDIDMMPELRPFAIDACKVLWKSCDQLGAYDVYEPVLLSLLKHPLDPTTTCQLGVYRMSEHLLDKSLITTGTGIQRTVHVAAYADGLACLKRGIQLFTTKTSKLEPLTQDQYVLGGRFISALASTDDWTFLAKLFWFLYARRGDQPIKHFLPLIMAESALGHHKRVQSLFESFVMDLTFTQHEFYQMIDIVIESSLSLSNTTPNPGQFDHEELLAERVLRKASDLASMQQLTNSTTWTLKVLQHHWDLKKDLQRVLRAFDRIEPHLVNVPHHEAIHSFMVEKALEAGDDSIAKSFAKRIEVEHGYLDIKTQGHFAVAKARQGAWDESEADLEAMCQSLEIMNTKPPVHAVEALQLTFSAIATLYAAKHSTQETESYVIRWIQRAHLCVDDRLDSIMVTTYARAGELDSIATWLDYTQTCGRTITSVHFNAMLSMVVKNFKPTLTSLVRLCEKTKAMNLEAIDPYTTLILRGEIRRKAKAKPELAGFWQHKIDRLKPILDKDSSKFTLETQMSDMLRRGQFMACMLVYTRATQHSSTAMSAAKLKIAVEACMQSGIPDRIDRATSMIKAAQSTGVDVARTMTPLLLHQISEPGLSYDEIRRMVGVTLTTLQKKNLEFPRQAATTIAATLVASKKSRAAIALWTTLWKYNQHFLRGMDIVDLTVLFDAYAKVNDMEGLQWVIKIMSKNHLKPDGMFKMFVKNNRKDKKQYMEAHPDDHRARDQFQVLDNCWQVTKAMRVQQTVDKDAAMRKVLVIMESASKQQKGAAMVTRSSLAMNDSNDAYDEEDIQRHLNELHTSRDRGGTQRRASVDSDVREAGFIDDEGYSTNSSAEDECYELPRAQAGAA